MQLKNFFSLFWISWLKKLQSSNLRLQENLDAMMTTMWWWLCDDDKDNDDNLRTEVMPCSHRSYKESVLAWNHEQAEASFGGLGGRRPQRKKKKRKKKEEKEKKRKNERKKEGNYMNNVKLLHIKCCFFQFFNSPVTLKNLKKIAPQEKVEMTPL